MTKRKLHVVKINHDNITHLSSEIQIRLDDRDYDVGDPIVFREHKDGNFTGSQQAATITHVIRDFEGLKSGYVVLRLELKSLVIYEGDRYVSKK